MIKVTLFKNDSGFYGFKSKGHADYDDYGKDIVCAAVSVLTNTVCNSIVYNCNLKEGDYIYKEDDGYLEFYSKVQNHDVDLILKTLLEGVKRLEESYGQYVRLEMEERYV